MTLGTAARLSPHARRCQGGDKMTQFFVIGCAIPDALLVGLGLQSIFNDPKILTRFDSKGRDEYLDRLVFGYTSPPPSP